ncbi:MAG: hypothetical protein AB7U18_27985, partial [Dehalococcoidia bacterium]
MVEARGLDAAQAGRILDISQAFDANPRQVLEQLAKDAGLEVFFERPLPDDQIPEFKTTAEMAAWMDKRQQERAAADRAAAEKQTQEKLQRAAATERLRNEFAAAQRTYGAVFETQRTAVVDRMTQPLSVEDAFLLTQLPTLRKHAEEGIRAKQELAAAKAELEGLRKRATQPPAGVMAGQSTGVDESRLSPAERALRRATARKAAATHA